MQNVLHHKPPLGFLAVDISTWERGMRERIQTWYNNMPRGPELEANERRIIENFDLTYYRALFYLYQPSPNRPVPDETAWLRTADAAKNMIQYYLKFFEERRFTIYWQAVEGLSAAGTVLLRGYITSPAIRGLITLLELRELVQTSSRVLWGMVEHFPAFKPKREAFDRFATTVMNDLEMGASPVQDYGYSEQQNDLAQNVYDSTANLPQSTVHHASDDPLHMTDEFAGNWADFETAAFDWDALESTAENLPWTWN